jgi:hypothetical protein
VKKNAITLSDFFSRLINEWDWHYDVRYGSYSINYAALSTPAPMLSGVLRGRTLPTARQSPGRRIRLWLKGPQAQFL